jgi:hypothetical protein
MDETQTLLPCITNKNSSCHDRSRRSPSKGNLHLQGAMDGVQYGMESKVRMKFYISVTSGFLSFMSCPMCSCHARPTFNSRRSGSHFLTIIAGPIPVPCSGLPSEVMSNSIQMSSQSSRRRTGICIRRPNLTTPIHVPR